MFLSPRSGRFSRFVAWTTRSSFASVAASSASLPRSRPRSGRRARASRFRCASPPGSARCAHGTGAATPSPRTAPRPSHPRHRAPRPACPPRWRSRGRGRCKLRAGVEAQRTGRAQNGGDMPVGTGTKDLEGVVHRLQGDASPVHRGWGSARLSRDVRCLLPAARRHPNPGVRPRADGCGGRRPLPGADGLRLKGRVNNVCGNRSSWGRHSAVASSCPPARADRTITSRTLA